jgi:hypothetical protein
MEIDQQNEVGDFEDEFEDEFESEDEILEAGVDGRPDEEREAEERESRSRETHIQPSATNASRWHGRGPRYLHPWPTQTLTRRDVEPRSFHI